MCDLAAGAAPIRGTTPPRTKLYISFVAVLGIAVLVPELRHWHSESLPQLGCYFVAGLLTAGLRVSLPPIAGTLPVNFLFILFGIVQLNLPETLVIACAATLIQCVLSTSSRSCPTQAMFQVAAVSVATEASFYTYTWLHKAPIDPVARLLATVFVFFFLNTFLAAAAVAPAGCKGLAAVWRNAYLSSFPYYVVGATMAGIMDLANRYVGWQSALLVVPAFYLIYRSYRLYLDRIDDEKKHAAEMNALHLRTIEALALAIEAKDHTTHDHLERVQVYAVEIGKHLGLNRDELEALQAASLLHDIGKLAVPEHIISKPGRLTPEEFEKMKIHPVVGAKILERVQFPYPVAPIVMSHHERWDGGGYPQGLAGEAIPIGARILAAVDCLDALASDRQYRRALSLDDAMKHVVSESGKAFDPRVVEALRNRYLELERKAVAKRQNLQLPAGVKIANGAAPGAGFENSGAHGGRSPADFLQLIAAARQEVQSLFELAQDLGNSLSVDETLAVLAARLRRMIPCDSMAIYIRKDGVLSPEYVTGDDFRLFSSVQIPVGEGLSGWVAENRRPIVNGNPSVEPGYMKDPKSFSRLRSALSVPLEGLGGVLGVLSLYRADKDAFSEDDLRILLAISSRVALSVENALRFQHVETSATNDYLTSLPNARSLFLHLESELSRARRTETPLAVLVSGLDGFKQVNDRFGHLAGNTLLRLIARGLKQSCREYDFVARMGGDEFVLILPGLAPGSLEERCNQFREVVIQAGREVCGTSSGLDISIGHASFPADSSEAAELLAEADRRMYRRKGGNKMRPGSSEVLDECAAARF